MERILHFRLAPLFLLSLLLAYSPVGTADELRDLISDFRPSAEEQAAGAVVLRNTKNIRVSDDGNHETSGRVVIAILDRQAARDYSRIRISYNSYYDSVELEQARLIDAEGVEHVLREDAVQVKTGRDQGGYDDRRVLVFSLPSVAPGSFIEYRLKVRSLQPVMPGYWYDHQWLHRPQALAGRVRLDPVRRAELHVNLPAGRDLMVSSNASQWLVSDQTRGDRRQLEWLAEQLVKVEPEPGMADPFADIAYVMMTLVPDWKTLNHWADGIFNSAARSTPAIGKQVAELVTADMSDMDKLQAIFYWVQQNVRYIISDLRRGGIVPLSAGQVFANRYGDCKNQSVLLVTMLRAAGIDAYPVLTNLQSPRLPNPELPRVGFNHMIVAARVQGRMIYMDASSDAGRFPGLDGSLGGQLSLVVDGKSNRLVALPGFAPEDNQVLVVARWDTEGEDQVIDLEMEPRGVMLHRHRVMLDQGPAIREEMEKTLGNLLGNRGRMENFRIDGADSMDDPLIYRVRVVFEDDWKKENRKNYACAGLMAKTVNQFSGLLALPEKERRYDLDFEIPARFRLITHCNLPGPEYRPVGMVSPLKSANRYYAFEQTVAESPERMTVTQTFDLKADRLPASEYLAFVQGTKTLLMQKAQWLQIFARDEKQARLTRLQNRVEKDADALDARISLARELMNRADYEAARDALEPLIRTAPDSGEVNYLYGLVLGFLDDFDASERHLKKSEELGYRP